MAGGHPIRVKKDEMETERVEEYECDLEEREEAVPGGLQCGWEGGGGRGGEGGKQYHTC